MIENALEDTKLTVFEYLAINHNHIESINQQKQQNFVMKQQEIIKKSIN